MGNQNLTSYLEEQSDSGLSSKEESSREDARRVASHTICAALLGGESGLGCEGKDPHG